MFYWFLSFGGALIINGWGVERWGRTSYLGPAEIASFFQPESNKHDTFWHVVWTGYFYVLWAIAVSDFCLLEIYKNFCLPVSTITFTVNSHTDNCLYKYICFNYYKVSNQSFLLKYTLRVFIFIKTMVYRKNSL